MNSGFCGCNCGGRTKRVTVSCPARGLQIGDYYRFIKGHGTRKPLAARFWTKVDRKGEDECWAWLGATVRFGRGRIVDGQSVRLATHVALELHGHQPLPPKTLVLHTCDHPWCVNPRHLYVGDQKQNMRDRDSRQRNASARLTPDDIRAIRGLISDGVLTRKQIAERFNIPLRYTWEISSRRVWAWVT